MEQLSAQLKKVLANTFTLYLKSHGFHWNVEGPGFPQYHEFFNDLYDELWNAVDPIAEHIRTLDVYAPASMTRYIELSEIHEEESFPYGGVEMARQLLNDNKTVLISLYAAQILANEAKEIGLANFLQDRIDIHKKHEWMLRSITK